MSLIKVLDCTLRDGGYVNNWEFGEDRIKSVIFQLSDAGIDYIEIGFLSGKNNGDNSTLFSSIERALDYIHKSNTRYTLMLNYGEVPLNKIVTNDGYNLEIRIAFKKHHLGKIEEFLLALKDKGYNVGLNPMHTSLYTEKELAKLVNICQTTNPTCLSVVDTMGVMTEIETERLFKYLQNNTPDNIALGFHSHNNLQLSYSNTKKLLEMIKNRKLIIDSCLAGMGRGVGILQTELITEFLNKNYGCKYNLDLITKTLKEAISPIIPKNDKKRDYIYYLSAKNRCHPNYAKYLIENTNYSAGEINEIFSMIPANHKPNYNREIISRIIKNRENIDGPRKTS